MIELINALRDLDAYDACIGVSLILFGLVLLFYSAIVGGLL